MKKTVFGVIIPIVIGGAIYVFLRENEVLLLKLIGIDFSNINSLKLPQWVIYNLPDGLWGLSLTNLMILIWNERISSKNIFWILSPIMLGITLEVLQAINFLKGTFDVLDVLFIISFSLFSILYNLKQQLRWKEQRISSPI